jgi:glucose/mannose-6-phosphate isomerase
VAKKCKIVAITSGGELEKLSESEGIILINAPKGKPPRASVAYLLMPIVVVLKKLGIYDPQNEITIAVDTLKELRDRMGPENPTKNNQAKQIAKELQGKTPIIYGEGIFNAIARRWQTQLNENSKILAWHSSFPEMNHNEIEAWVKDDKSKIFTAILLRDDFRAESQLQKRVKLTKTSILEPHLENVIEIVAKGGEERDYLARMLYSMYLGDFVSIYLAILQDINPSPVSAIEAFKQDLSGI